MKRTIFLSIIVIAATILQAQEQILKPINSLQKMPNKNIKASNNLKGLNTASIETFDDSVITNVNGLPAGWSYTPNNANTDYQWIWTNYLDTSNGFIGILNNNAPMSETIYTNTSIVPSSNAYLSFDFMCSYYWMIMMGTDSLEISYTIDGGSTWVRLWSNRDQALVEASGVAWPYPSWIWQSPVIELPSSTYGQNIQYKILLEGSTGYTAFIDNFSSGSTNNIDIGIENIAPQFGNNDGWYSKIPLSQMQEFTNSKALVKNLGQTQVDEINMDINIETGGTNVYTDNINTFVSGSNSLVNFYDEDTLNLNSNYLPNQLGTYNITYSLNQTQTDEDLTDNELIYNFEVTDSIYARYNTINSQISTEMFGGGSYDYIGCAFTFTDTIQVNSLTLYIADVDDTTGLGVYIYDSNFQTINSSDDFYANAYMANTTQTINLMSPTTLLIPGTYYIGVKFYWNNSNRIYIGAEKGFNHNYENSTIFIGYDSINGNYHTYINNYMPAIELNTTPYESTHLIVNPRYNGGNTFASNSVATSLYSGYTNSYYLYEGPDTLAGSSFLYNIINFNIHYYIKSQILDTITYSDYIPIYFYDAPTIDSSTYVIVPMGSNVSVTIEHPMITLLPGTNTVQGALNTLSAKSTGVSNELVILQDANTNEVLTATVSDTNGHYTFGNVTDNLSLRVFVTSFDYPHWTAAEFTSSTDNNYEFNFICNNDSVYPDGTVSAHFVETKNIVFSFYPNPAKDILHLENISSSSNLKIFSQTGKLIISDDRKEKTSIDISDLAKGTYIIVITNNDGSIGTQKFVKE